MMFSFFIWSLSWFYDLGGVTMPGDHDETPKA